MNLRGAFASLFREKKPAKDDSIRGLLLTLMKSDKFPEKWERFSGGPITLRWDNGLIVTIRDTRHPRVDVSRNNQLQFTYEHDEELVDAVMKFSDRADSARDRTNVIAAIHDVLQ
jgi:hypothetical protein